MTREEASFYLANMDRKYMEKGMSEALDMAIMALEQNESAEKWYKLFVKKLDEQEPCDDAVSRQAVLDVIYGQHIGGKEAVEHGLRNTYAADLRGIADDIIALPSVRPQEQTGHWIRQDNTKEPLYGWYFCSECNSVIGDKTKFCSNCGCRMVEPQESEDK